VNAGGLAVSNENDSPIAPFFPSNTSAITTQIRSQNRIYFSLVMAENPNPDSTTSPERENLEKAMAEVKRLADALVSVKPQPTLEPVSYPEHDKPLYIGNIIVEIVAE